MRSRRDPVNVSLVIRSRLEEFGLEQQDLAQAADGGARAVGGPRAQGAIEARAGGRARAVVSGSPRVDPPQVPTRRRTTRARRVREGALRRTGAPGHPEAEGLLLEHGAHVSFGVGLALAEDQRADFPKQRRGLVPQLSLQLLLALVVRQPR